MSVTVDLIDERTARAVAAFLDLPLDGVVAGAPLPLMWHLFYFLAYPAQSEIGPDGHPAVGESTPLGTRRMFAGGRVTLQPGLRIGDSVTATQEITAETVRDGKSGRLRFVTHRTALGTDADAPTLIAERDIVYIPLAKSGAEPAEPVQYNPPQGAPSPALEADVHRSIQVTPTMLFRFSALTYNAHRIHYDREYARVEEGYRGLVVHGPLQSVLMAELASKHWQSASTPSRFSYRLVAPLFEDEGLFVTATHDDAGGVSTQIISGDGRVTATGRLEA